MSVKRAHAGAPSQRESGGRLTDFDVAGARRALLRWYTRARRDLPWRRTRDPYAIWVSEVMLQQTRVETVIPYYERFLAEFPTVRALADAPREHVLRAWAGLGYYRRARLLHEGAQQLRGAGALPSTRAALLEVRGIGRYTAGAVASIAFEEPVGLVDGNVARVLARLLAIDEEIRGRVAREVERIADALVPPRRCGDFNQALMELGATVCTPRAPRCDVCPVARLCRAHGEGRVAELPRRAGKAPPREERMRALLASAGDAILLGRRRESVRFGGMWEPPCAGDDGGPSWPSGLVVRTAPEPLQHVLTHRRLEIAVDVVEAPARALRRAARALASGRADVYDAVELVPVDALSSLALSALARKLMAARARFTAEAS